MTRRGYGGLVILLLLNLTFHLSVVSFLVYSLIGTVFENRKICAAAVIFKDQVSKTLMLPPPPSSSK